MKAHTQTNVVLEVGGENVGRTFGSRVEKMQFCLHLLWELMPILYIQWEVNVSMLF